MNVPVSIPLWLLSWSVIASTVCCATEMTQQKESVAAISRLEQMAVGLSLPDSDPHVFSDLSVCPPVVAFAEIPLINITATVSPVFEKNGEAETIEPIVLPGCRESPIRPIESRMTIIEGAKLEEGKQLLVYRGLVDGMISPRQPQWRPSLLRMLTDGTRQVQFDRVFTFLLSSFPGNDSMAKLDKLHRWAQELPPHAAGDIWRATTRYWLNAGEYERALVAADAMERLRPDYRIRACRLKALALASAGKLNEARRKIHAVRKEVLPRTEEAELLYLEAWIDLQDGDIAKAKIVLAQVVKMRMSAALTQKARKILQSLSNME